MALKIQIGKLFLLSPNEVVHTHVSGTHQLHWTLHSEISHCHWYSNHHQFQHIHPADVIARIYLVEHIQVVQQLDFEQREQQNWGPRLVPLGEEWVAKMGAVVVVVGPPHLQTQQHWRERQYNRRSSNTVPSTLEKLKVGVFPLSLSTTLLALSVTARFSELLCNFVVMPLDLVHFSASFLPSFLPLPQSLLLVMLLL